MKKLFYVSLIFLVVVITLAIVYFFTYPKSEEIFSRHKKLHVEQLAETYIKETYPNFNATSCRVEMKVKEGQFIVAFKNNNGDSVTLIYTSSYRLTFDSVRDKRYSDENQE